MIDENKSYIKSSSYHEVHQNVKFHLNFQQEGDLRII